MPVFPATTLDHCSYVVPDLDAAVQFFGTYFGFEVVSTHGPLQASDDQLTRVFAVPARAVGRWAFLQCGATRLEFVEWKVYSEALNPLRESTVPGCHIALRVADLDATVAELRNIPRMRFLEPSADGSFVYCLTPYGFQLQLMRSAPSV
jgi:hypothetical protein